MLDRVGKLMHNVTIYICAWALILMTLVIFLQVICRFVFMTALPWSEEAARYLMVWATFLGAAIAALEKGHIGVSFLTDALSGKWVRIFKVVNISILTICFAVVVFYAFKLVSFIYETGQVSPAMEIPMFLPYAALPIGLVLTGICIWLVFLKDWREERDK